MHGADGEIRPVDEADLPVELPELQDFRPAASDDPAAPPRPAAGPRARVMAPRDDRRRRYGAS